MAEDEVEKVRLEGNAAFKAGNFAEALEKPAPEMERPFILAGDLNISSMFKHFQTLPRDPIGGT